MSYEWANYPFGKYKKAKYKLYINNEVAYSFVTTIRDEENCINVLREMAENYISKYTKKFSITKTTDEGSKTIFTGSIKAT